MKSSTIARVAWVAALVAGACRGEPRSQGVAPAAEPSRPVTHTTVTHTAVIGAQDRGDQAIERGASREDVIAAIEAVTGPSTRPDPTGDRVRAWWIHDRNLCDELALREKAGRLSLDRTTFDRDRSPAADWAACVEAAGGR